MKNTKENREKLAEKVVEGWDAKTLVNYAIDQTCKFYVNDDEKFQQDWENAFGSP